MNGNKSNATTDRWGPVEGPRPMPILPRTQATATSDFKPFGSPNLSSSMPIHNHPTGAGNISLKPTARPAILNVSEQPTNVKTYQPTSKASFHFPSSSFTISTCPPQPDRNSQKPLHANEFVLSSTQGPKTKNLTEPLNGPIVITTNDTETPLPNSHCLPASVPRTSINVVSGIESSSTLTSSPNQSSPKPQVLSTSTA